MEGVTKSRILNSVRGALACVAVGDALGVPHEFWSQRDNVYTGILYIAPYFKFRWSERTDVVGQYSDDTEMTLAAARSISSKGFYDEEDIILRYEDWARSAKAMGRNTRRLLGSIKTVKGYRARFRRFFTDIDPETWTQSNGALMRCSLLSFMGKDAVVADCSLTNPHPTTIGANVAYSAAIRSAVEGKSKSEIFRVAIEASGVEDVNAVIRSAWEGAPREVNTKQKGWVLHGLYAAFWGFFHHDTFQDAVDAVIKLGGDTDTNAAILGGLLGAYLGYEAITGEERTSKNFTIVREADFSLGGNPRLEVYLLDDFEELTENFAGVVVNTWGGSPPEDRIQ